MLIFQQAQNIVKWQPPKGYYGPSTPQKYCLPFSFVFPSPPPRHAEQAHVLWYHVPWNLYILECVLTLSYSVMVSDVTEARRLQSKDTVDMHKCQLTQHFAKARIICVCVHMHVHIYTTHTPTCMKCTLAQCAYTNVFYNKKVIFTLM